MTLCEKCIHGDNCSIRYFKDKCQERVMEFCANYKNEADYIERANLLDGISSTEFGLDEIVDELIYKYNLDFLHDNDEDAVREFAKDLIDCIKNYIKTQ